MPTKIISTILLIILFINIIINTPLFQILIYLSYNYTSYFKIVFRIVHMRNVASILMPYNTVFVVKTIVWTGVIRSGEESRHFVLIKIHHAHEAVVVLVVDVIGAGLAVGRPRSSHSDHLPAVAVVIEKFQYVARLTFQRFAYGVQRRKAYRADLSGFQLGEVDVADPNAFAKLVEGHLPVRHYAVKS